MFSKAEVLTIDSSYDAIHQKLSVMVREWLMRAGNDPGRQPSWRTVVEALRSSGISSLAGNIELKYCSPNIPHVSLDSVSSSSSVSGEIYKVRYQLSYNTSIGCYSIYTYLSTVLY